jgi:Fe-S oxidoreductase
MHYSLGWLPRWLKVVAFAPRLINALLRPRWIERIVVRLAGLDTRRHMPRFAATPFRKSATAKSRRATSGGTTSGAKGRLVVLWADSFTDGLDPAIPEALVAVLEDAGFDVAVSAGEACCGITWITTGQLEGARRRMEKLLGVLGPFAVNGVPIIGVEPSCMAALRSDLTELLPHDPRAHAVSRGVFTLAEILTGRGPIKPRDGWNLPDLSDVTAVVQPHCHHHSVMSFGADRELLASTGATVIEASGCCGMAGMWGTTPDHYDLAAKVAETSLLPALADAPEGSIYLADGYSCRTQADDLAGVTGRHLAQLLAERAAGGGAVQARPEGAGAAK